MTQWLRWLIGTGNAEAERLQQATGKLAGTLEEINGRLRLSAGLDDTATNGVNLIPPRPEVTAALENGKKGRK